MKYILLVTGIFLSLTGKAQIKDTTLLQPVEISSVRAPLNAPVARTTYTKADLQNNNTGLDLPFVLAQSPSVTVSSDAGNGIGYTGIRIRGTDPTRINVTLNGIPYNDAESQGVFFVDLPDIVSSAGSIQVQRGVGTSTNGAGAFGGSINISTNEIKPIKGLEFNNNFGSYHSFKNSLILNSGLIKKHFTLDGRISNIRSDGYIDRADSRLFSFEASAAYIDAKKSLRVNVLSGRERTYQAWYGIDEITLRNNRRFNSAGTEKPGTPYDNETDNYTQSHYQVFFNHKLRSSWKLNIAAFITRGKGYYEQYKADQSLSAYGLPDYYDGANTITETDLIRQLWLDNIFYGNIFSFQLNNTKRQVITGGGWSKYEGKHFGEIIRAQVRSAVPPDHRWYNTYADKTDVSAYAKWIEKLGNVYTFLDIQLRHVNYHINGFRDNPSIELEKKYTFLNPKAGLTFQPGKYRVTLSYGHAAKEPNRDDFETGINEQPQREILHDLEGGISHSSKISWGINMYYMFYKDQLVLSGKINDVGAYSRINITKSYRTGIELEASGQLAKWMHASTNLTFSENKISGFTEYLDDYDNGGQVQKFYPKTTISFSPRVTGAATITVTPARKLEVALLSKYVSRQFLDNTAQKSRSLDPYFTEDVRLSYTWRHMKRIKELKLFAHAYNIFSSKYEPNGYSFSYINGGMQATENYFYPMAPFNWMIGLNIRL